MADELGVMPSTVSRLCDRLVRKWVKPAIGGAVVGLIAIEVPQVLGTGYGWIQHALGPGMVIGAFVGAAVWRLFEPAFPWMGDDPTPYVIIGMMCCFGSVARAPLAVMLMVAEMTGSIGSIEPGIIAVGLAWLIVSRGEETMYRSQLISRASDEHPPSVTRIDLPPTRLTNAPF